MKREILDIRTNSSNRPCKDCDFTWAQWSLCSKSCGGGSRERTPKITREARPDGKPCPSAETEKCNETISGEGWEGHTHPCPVAGGWSSWGYWGVCSSGSHRRRRERTCTNPAPSHGGLHCEGDRVESEVCRVKTRFCWHNDWEHRDNIARGWGTYDNCRHSYKAPWYKGGRYYCSTTNCYCTDLDANSVRRNQCQSGL